MEISDFCSFPEFGIFQEAISDTVDEASFLQSNCMRSLHLAMTLASAVRGGRSPLIQSSMSVKQASASVFRACPSMHPKE